MNATEIKNLSQSFLIEELEKYFSIEELVDATVARKYGRRAWRFFDRRLLDSILWVRINIDASITVNNWKWGGQFDERGLRTNISPLVRKKTGLYLSAHLRGAALDFDVKGYTAPEVREWLKDHAPELPHKIRLEDSLNGKALSWVHLDVDSEPHNPKVYAFAV